MIKLSGCSECVRRAAMGKRCKWSRSAVSKRRHALGMEVARKESGEHSGVRASTVSALNCVLQGSVCDVNNPLDFCLPCGVEVKDGE